ncbi:MAG TPA: hypothetical protein H9902_08585 [Candidatus Stackebrandtia faecavium]|nr:hypothetical protein [Candidatus Stackebrandtia faecavium]
MSFRDAPQPGQQSPGLGTNYTAPDDDFTVQQGFGGVTHRPVPVTVLVASVALFLSSIGNMVELVARMLEFNVMLRTALIADLWLVFRLGLLAVATAAAAAVILFGREWGRVFALAISGIVIFSSTDVLLFYPMSVIPMPLPLLLIFHIVLSIVTVVILTRRKISIWHYEKRRDRSRSPFTPPDPDTQAKPAAFHFAAGLLLAIGLFLLGYSAIQLLFARFSFERWPHLSGVEFVLGASAIALGVLTFRANGIARLLAFAVAGATAWTGFDLMATNVMYTAEWGIYDGLYDVRYWVAMVLLLLSAIASVVLLMVLSSHKCADWVHERHAIKAKQRHCHDPL